MPEAGLYVHIPFCRRKCAYCDFASYAGLEDLQPAYLDAVRQEAASAAAHWAAVRFTTVYVGGGTPTSLPAADLAGLLTALRACLAISPDAEVTVEANPGTVHLDGLVALRSAGVNRLSVGVQSFDEASLALLGRIHSAHEACVTVDAARVAGFRNLSLDLMFGLPCQTLPAWRDTLQRAIDLAPEHLSLYALTVENGTPLRGAIASGRVPAPDDGLAADMYELATDVLDAAGYAQYEISNWARRSPADPRALDGAPLLACRHNLNYWRNGRYLGLGSAATTYDGTARTTNVAHPRDFIRLVAASASPVAMRDEPSPASRLGETMMLGLRLMAGVTRADFVERTGMSLDEVYGPAIARLVDDGLLISDAVGIRLTRRGRLLGNRVFVEFLPGA